MTLAVNIAQIGSNNTTFRNRIINGAMVIDQRNAGAAVTNNNYCTDRWRVETVSDGVFSAQQVSDAPTGFVKSLKWTTTTADSNLTTNQYAIIRQGIEGFNTADLMWGTANAKTITVSFWVKSSLTGTFGGTVHNSDATRSYPYSYTISAANTWEQKSVTIAGDTTGTWTTDNNAGIQIYWGLGVGPTYSGTANTWAASIYIAPTGAVSVIGTLNATFYITGVQLEAGTTASPFEYRSYGTELALCQRYFSTSFQGGGTPASPDSLSVTQTGAQFTNCNSVNAASVNFSVQMRSAPTVSIYAPLVSPAVGKVRKSVDGFIFTNGAASFIGERGFFPSGGDANNPFQYGWVASAEL